MINEMDTNTIILNAQNKSSFDNSNEIFNPTIIYIVEGNMEFTIKDTQHTCGKDSLVLISPFDCITDVKHENIKLVEITLSKSKLYDIPSSMLISVLKSRPEGFKNVVDCANDPLIKVLFEKIVTEFASERILKDTSLDNAIIQLLIELYRLAFEGNPTKHIDLVTEIQKYIDAEYMNNITIEELGSRFYLDRYYLSHIFKEYTGYSLKQYLTLSRLNESRILLKDTDLSINEICTTIGFSDINNFIRYFRKEYATTPLVYRKSIIK